MGCSLYLALIHYPIYNRRYEVITTAITNYDIHDIARAACTYGLKKYFIVHPLKSQQDLVQELLAYWQIGFGGEYNKDRSFALEIVSLEKNIECVLEKIIAEEGIEPEIVTTDARTYENTISYAFLREKINNADNRPILLLFGTGFGIEKQTMQNFDYVLEPVYGSGDYNHLSVRSAVAIILDRLLGR